MPMDANPGCQLSDGGELSELATQERYGKGATLGVIWGKARLLMK
jgi:hypothetical protein